MPLTTLLAKEARNLDKMQAIEDKALAYTARQLSNLIRERFGKASVVTKTATTEFADVFVHAMVLAWLMGQYHVIQTLKEEVTLADDNDIIVTFDEAIDALKSKVPMDAKAYGELEANLKLRAFTIASVIGEESINKVKQLYVDAMSQRLSKSEALQQLDGFLEKAGISAANPFWLDLHYRNNMMSAYNTGRWTQVEHNAAVEYLMYSAVRDDGTTKLCKHLDRTVKPKTAKFWRKYYPPNHHKCRAIVIAVSKAMYDRLPDKEKNKQVTEMEINQDAVMAKEHQFKNSPTVALSRLPKGLVEKMNAFDLRSQVITQSYKQNESKIQSVVTVATGRIISSSAAEKAISKHNGNLPENAAILLAETTQKPDDIIYGLCLLSNGDAKAVTWFIHWLDSETASVARVAAFGNGVIEHLVIMSKSEVAVLRKDAKVVEKSSQ